MFNEIYTAIIDVLTDPWVLFGFTAQFVFFFRFVVQWVATERAKETRVPVAFWYLSIIGAMMILTYAIYRRDIVFISGQALALGIYFRNLHIHYKQKARQESVTETTPVTK